MTNEPVGARDQRPPSLGLGRIIIALFWLLGAWILVTAILDLFHAQGQPWGPRIVALLAGIDYLIAATSATALLCVAAERAAKRSVGPGAFAQALVDELFLVSPDEVGERGGLRDVTAEI